MVCIGFQRRRVNAGKAEKKRRNVGRISIGRQINRIDNVNVYDHLMAYNHQQHSPHSDKSSIYQYTYIYKIAHITNRQ